MSGLFELITLDLKRDEGLRLKPYKDTAGKLTVGYGRNLDDVGLSDDEAAGLLHNDVSRSFYELSKAFHWFDMLPFAAKRGLINMAYNIGLTRLCQFTKMLDALAKGDYDRAAEEALDSQWANQVGDRADRIAALYRSCCD